MNICLLLLILVLTAISCFFNYSLFRNHTPLYVETAKEKEQDLVYHNEASTSHPTLNEKNDEAFTIIPNELNVNYISNKYTIEIGGSREWNAPSSSLDWVSFEKKDENHLIINLKDNNSDTERTTTILINNKQLKICQEGKKYSSATTPDFGLVVYLDSERKTKIDPKSTVYPGQKLYASATKAAMASGYGWTYLNCNGDTRNVKESNITINGSSGQTATFGYGLLGSDPSKRQRISFKIEAKSKE